MRCGAALHSDDPKGWIQMLHLCHVAGNEREAILPGAQGDRSIDDVCCPPDTTKLTGCASGFIIQRLDVDRRG